MTRWLAALLAVLCSATGLIMAAGPAHANSLVCNIYCDGRDPNLAAIDRSVDVASQWGRSIVLHMDDADHMAWSNISGGQMGDETWLDRSYDGGASVSDSRLGDTSIPSGHTGWRTMLYNVDKQSQQGWVRACGKAGDRPEIACTSWRPVADTPCGVHCDVWDPASAAGDRSAATAVLQGRNIVLHFDDPDNMAWSNIDGGQSGDETWLERALGRIPDGSGTRLGDTSVPSGHTGWRTMMYNVDFPQFQQVGAVRACGLVAGATQPSCTGWMHAATHAATTPGAGATALMQMWNSRSGTWSGGVGGWQDANALTSMIDYIQRSGDTTYAYVIPQVFNHNLRTDGSQLEQNFTDGFMDDTGWWGVAWLRAYELTGDSRYLTTAEADSDYMAQYWDNVCGGGVWWSDKKDKKQAIENTLYLELNTRLYNDTGSATYLARASQEWSWFRASGLIDASNFIDEGLNPSTCTSDGSRGHSYDQGVFLEGAAQFAKATSAPQVLVTAHAVALAATSTMTTNGVLFDGNHEDVCGADVASFKGAFMRGIYEYARDSGDQSFATFLTSQTPAILTSGSANVTSDGRVGLMWAPPLTDKATFDYPCQQSAQDAFNATFPVAPMNEPHAATAVTANGVLNIFVRAANGDLVQSYLPQGGSWHEWDITGAGYAQRLSGSPVAVVEGNGTLDVFYRSGDGHLWRSYLPSGGGWTQQDLTTGNAAPVIAGDPSVIASNGALNVFSRGAADGHLIQSSGSSGSWSRADLTASGAATALTGDPVAYGESNGTQDVFYQAVGGDLIRSYRPSAGSWSRTDVTTATSGSGIAGDPTVTMMNGTLDVFSRDAATGHLIQGSLAPSGVWSKSDVTAAGGATALAGSPVAWLEPSGKLDVFYRDSNSDLVQSYYSGGSWSRWDVTGAGYATSITGKPSLTADANGTLNIFTKGATSADLVQSYLSPAGWNMWDVTSAGYAPTMG